MLCLSSQAELQSQEEEEGRNRLDQQGEVPVQSGSGLLSAVPKVLTPPPRSQMGKIPVWCFFSPNCLAWVLNSSESWANHFNHKKALLQSVTLTVHGKKGNHPWQVGWEEWGLGEQEWRAAQKVPRKQCGLADWISKHLPVLSFLFPGSCAFQNALQCLGRYVVLNSSNCSGLSKAAAPKIQTGY